MPSEECKQRCRICYEYSDKQTMLSGICACKSDAQPIYEHRECVTKQIEGGSNCCSVCKQKYNIRYDVSMSKSVWLLFNLAVYPVILAVAINIFWIGPSSRPVPALFLRMLVGCVLYTSQKKPARKPSTSYVLLKLLALLLFVVLDVIHFNIYQGSYIIHPGYVLLICIPSEKAVKRCATHVTVLSQC